MSMYRSTIMLYSSIFALNLAAPSLGLCDIKSEAIDVKKLKITSTEDKQKGIEGAPVSEEELALHEKAVEELNDVQKRKLAFAVKIKDVIDKYKTALTFIIGKDVNIKEKIINKNNQITELLTSFSENQNQSFEKTDEFSKKLEEKLNSMHTFILSEKDSIPDDSAWFDAVHKYALSQLEKLQKLRKNIKENNGIQKRSEELKAINTVYAERLKKFLSAYTVFSLTSSYLKNGKSYCHDRTIGGHFMKFQFPHFASTFFEGADNIHSGTRLPMTVIGQYSLFAIDKKLYENSGFSSAITPESEDGLLINTVKDLSKNNKVIADQLKSTNGGLILSSKIMFLGEMKRPLCVFKAYSIEGDLTRNGKECIYRFSLDDATPEQIQYINAQKNDATTQLIDSENKEAYDKIAAADELLGKTLNDRKEEKNVNIVKKETASKSANDNHSDDGKSDRINSRQDSATGDRSKEKTEKSHDDTDKSHDDTDKKLNTKDTSSQEKNDKAPKSAGKDRQDLDQKENDKVTKSAGKDRQDLDQEKNDKVTKSAGKDRQDLDQEKNDKVTKSAGKDRQDLDQEKNDKVTKSAGKDRQDRDQKENDKVTKSAGEGRQKDVGSDNPTADKNTDENTNPNKGEANPTEKKGFFDSLFGK